MSGKTATSRGTAGSNKRLSKTALFILLFASTLLLTGMQQPGPGRRVTRIYIENADSTLRASKIKPNTQILMGNVQFRHDSTLLFCDSAYLYGETNSLEAFGMVRIEQGDTLVITGNYLIYQGNISLAEMHENVRMVHRDEVTLFTDHLDYDRILNIGYYYDGGMIVDSLNELTSVYGQYSPDTKVAFFKEDVQLLNPNFTLHSDTLEYNTESKIATILGSAVIESDSGKIWTDRGWYNTQTEESMLYDRSLVVSRDETKTITADSLHYNKLGGLIKAYGNMVLNDTLKRVMILGDYGFYNELTGFAFATDSAQMIEYSQPDSLFLHGDTLKMETLETERRITAYYGVRFFREDLQGVCDSLQFNTADSLLYLYKNPILWNTGFQINGDTIKVMFNDSTLEKVDVLNYAFAIEEKDSTYFNQMKGRNLYAYFTAGELRLIDILGASESIYYPIDDKDASYIGRNRTASDNMRIWIEERKPVKILWYSSTQAELLPMPDLNPTNKYLPGFINFNYLRPRSKEDIFSTVQMKAEDIPPPRRKRGEHRTGEKTPFRPEIQPIKIDDHDHDHDHDHDGSDRIVTE